MKEMKLLVVIEENLPNSERDKAIMALLTSINTPYIYSVDNCQV